MTLSRRTIAACTLIAAALTLGVSRSSEAALFLKIEANAAAATCDNGTAAGVSTCSANGFSTTLDANLITFTGDVGGYGLSGVSVGANVPGTASSAYVLDTRFDVSHASGPGALAVSFGGYNFTQPIGPDLSLTATQSANWTTSAVGDSVTFQAWGRTDNLPEVPAGAATAVAATLVSPGGAAADSSSVDAPFTTLATPFALTGTATIQQAIGETATYAATVAAQDGANSSADVSAAAVPEPSTMVLLGTGVVGLFFWRRRNERMSVVRRDSVDV